MRGPFQRTTPSRRTVFALAHDAGGAEILAAYIRKHKKGTHFSVYAGGPARAIFERERIYCKPEPRRTELRNVLEKHRDGRALLGTGKPPAIEFAALKEAKRQRMKTAAYIDSWTNYRERFGYPRKGWQKNLPDEVWVGDIHALALAKRYLAASRIRFVPNQYFATAVARYRSRARFRKRPRGILYMNAFRRFSERLLIDFLTECSRRKVKFRIRVRMHPAHSRSRYERIVHLYGRSVCAELSREKDIVNDLLHARVVIGPETNALVLALHSGLKTIRIVPRGNRSFLPFKKITRVKNANAAVRLMLGE